MVQPFSGRAAAAQFGIEKGCAHGSDSLGLRAGRGIEVATRVVFVAVALSARALATASTAAAAAALHPAATAAMLTARRLGALRRGHGRGAVVGILRAGRA